MKQPGTLELFTYWDRLRAGRLGPLRAEVEPADVKAVLADMFILENGARDMPAFRLAGTRVCNVFCREIKAAPFESFFAREDRAVAATIVSAAQREGLVSVAGLAGASRNGRTAMFELLVLPLCDAEPRILGSVVSTDKPFWLGVDPVETLTIASLRMIDPNRQPAFLANRPEIPLGERHRPWFGDVRRIDDRPGAPMSRPTGTPVRNGRSFGHLTVIDGGI
ncbi:MAG TPA: PAS domain-containing protein [Rhizobiaceae bacterium]|nr:PAS domain-containing protein [Rhizobiaceae bacterium]